MLILSCLILSIGFSIAQTTPFTGTVVDDTGEAVIGASVVVKGTTVGTITDVDGKFTINVPAGKKTLVFSLIGMISKEAAASQGMRVVLSSDDKLLEEIVVTGYGIAKKETFTGAATTVSSKALTELTVTSADKALQGNSAGLLTQASSGQPGAGQKVLIRGIGSIMGGTEPLWVIDGVPVATGNFGKLTSTGQVDYSDNSNALAGINPSDIASMTVLKDASATSIYGSRAANGVILVTTKSGSEGKTKLSINSSYGWSSRATKKFKVMNSEQYTEYLTEAIVNAGDPKYDTAAKAQAFLYSKYPKQADGAMYNYDWMKETYKNDAPTYNIDVSATGGNAKTKFYVSGGYFNQEGILESSKMSRISNKFNLTHNYSDKFRFGINSTLSFSKQDTPLTTSSYYGNPVLASAVVPNLDPAYIDGEPRPNLSFLSANFKAAVKYNYAKQRTFRVIESAFAEYDIIDGLTFKTQWGVDFLHMNEAQWDDPKVGGNTAVQTNGRAARTSIESLIWNGVNTLNYNKTFDTVHNIGIMAGQELTSNSYRDIDAAAEGFPTTEFKEMTAGANPAWTDSYRRDTRLASFFGRANYSYDNKYIGSVSFRRDGSSVFSRDNLYANFWSVGGQWRISQESFMSGLTSTWLSNLGLRASYGTTGNSDISTTLVDRYYPSLGLYKGGYNYDGASGIVPTQIANPELKWEIAKSFNIGLDFAAFNNRLTATVEYYNKNTSDLLLNVPLSATTGFAQTISNVGNMNNKGVELSITGVPVATKDFEWTVSFNVSHNKNKVTKLYDGQDILNGTRITREGEDIQSIWTYKWAGVDPEDGAPMWYGVDDNGDDIKVKSITKANKRIVGSAAPKYYGGLTNSFKFKGFDISALIYFSQGNDITDQTLNMMNADGARGLWNQSTELLKRWQKPGDITDVPKAIYGVAPATYAPMSSRYVYDGSYIRLRNLNVGYTIPQVPGLRVYFQGTNLLTFTDYKGLDPEVGINGDPWFGYPVSKTITFGFNYNF